MKFLAILLLFCACNKPIYTNLNKDGSYEQLDLLWKKNGSYRGIILHYRSTYELSCRFTINNNLCDSFYFSKNLKTGEKTSRIITYIVSKKGEMKAEFSQIELQLITKIKKTVDSLEWCSSSILSIPESLYLTERIEKK